LWKMPRVIRRHLVVLALLLLAFLGPETAGAMLSDVQVQPIEVREDEEFNGLVATFDDDQYGDPTRFTATIHWGDGTASQGTIACRACTPGTPGGEFEVRGRHTWANPGDYTVRVVVEHQAEQDKAEGSGHARVLTRDQPPPEPQPEPEPQPPAPPAGVAPPGPPVPEGRPFTATIGKPYSGPVAFVPPEPGLTVTIDWGDGIKSPGNVAPDGTITGTHTFEKSGLHQVISKVKGQGGESIATTTANIILESDPEKCEKRIAFAKLNAVGACIEKIDGNTWEVRGKNRVRVNGLDIEPVAAATIRFDRLKLKLSSAGSVIVRAGPIMLYKGKISLDVAAELPGGFNVAAKAEIAGFPINGSLKVRFKNDPSVAEYGVTMAVVVELPKLFGGFTGGVDLRLNNRDGLVFDGMEVKTGTIKLGALTIKSLLVGYKRIGNEWKGGANVELPSGAGIDAAPPPADKGVLFRNGSLVSLGATLNFKDPGVAVASGVFLNSIGFGIGTSPTRFLGNAAFSTGKAGGKTLAKIDAEMFIVFARPDQPFTAPVGMPPKDRTFTSTSFYVAGTVTLAEKFNLGGAYVLYAHPGYGEFAGEFNYVLLSGLISARARIGVAMNTIRSQYNGEVSASVCAKVVGCVGGDLVISSTGIGACARTRWLDIGGGYFWNGTTYFMWRSCSVGRVRVAVTPGGARAAQADGGRRFTLPGGMETTVIGVQGRDGAPVVTIVSPSGRRYAAPAGGEPVESEEYLAQRADETKETYFVVPKPEAGTWTVEPAEGSTPVTGVQFAAGLPDPQVRARVSGRGRRRTVSYRVREIEGQKVTLYEQGRDTLAKIGEARGAEGRLRFKPNDASAGRRQIVAQIESFGTPRDTLVAGSYMAPGPVKPSKVRRLKATRRGSRVCASWRRGSGARQYEAVFRLSDGRKQMVATRRSRACVRRVIGRVRGRVEVRGVSARGTQSSAVRKALKTRRTRRARR
jgi:hypothetical protein